MSDFALVPADTRTSAELHAANLAAFADYIAGPLQLTLDQWPSLLGRQGIDLSLSRVALRDGEVLAFGYACPRVESGRWRLAIMGAVPAARGTGAAQALLDDFLARAQDAGMAGAELECFAQNERALKVYRSRGFERVCALNGWKPGSLPAQDAPPVDLRAIGREEALAWLEAANARVALLPFPNTHFSLASQPRPLTFWRCADALMAFSVVEGTPTTIHSLVDLDPALRGAEALGRAVRQAHADVVAPPVLRDDLGGAGLQRAGFELGELNQVLMTREFRATRR